MQTTPAQSLPNANVQAGKPESEFEHLAIDDDGCCLLREILPPPSVAHVTQEIARSLESDNAALVRYRSRTFGARNLADTWGGWRRLVTCGPIQQLLRKHVGHSFGLVRILYFDKPPGDGWSLPWHREQTIAVHRHIDPLTPFSKATVKAGVPHVEATVEVLRHMLTLRLSLDPMTANNGPLLFIPGSHTDDDKSAVEHSTALELRCDSGDVFAMRPRLLHASRKAEDSADTHRRVVHMEFAPADILPEPWQWHSFSPG